MIKQPGIVKIRGSRRLLLCDFDRPTPPRLQQLAAVLAAIDLRPVYVRYDRSHSGNWHVVIRVNRALTSGEIVAAQLALGSDPARERYNLRRVICGAPPAIWNLLFQSKL